MALYIAIMQVLGGRLFSMRAGTGSRETKVQFGVALSAMGVRTEAIKISFHVPNCECLCHCLVICDVCTYD